MPMPSQPGKYAATILEHTLGESGNNNLATFIARFQLDSLWDGETWHELGGDEAITGHFFIEKKDGNLNTYTIKDLEAGLGWDGDPAKLAEGYEGVRLIVAIEEDTYQGETKLRVRSLGPIDGDPDAVGGRGITKDPAAAASIANRLGGTLRAAGVGKTPANPATPPKPPAATTPPAAPPAAPTAAANDTPKPCDMETAWAAFVGTQPADASQEDNEAAWFEHLAEVFPGVDPQTFTPEQWGEVRDKVAPL